MVKKQDNTSMLYIIIAVLALIVVWLIWYFLWQGWNSSTTNTTSSDTPLIVEAWNMGIDKEELKQCVASDKYLDRINTQMKIWADNFGITWTPGNVLINNETMRVWSNIMSLS